MNVTRFQKAVILAMVLATLLPCRPRAKESQPGPGADIFATNAPVLRIKIETSGPSLGALMNDPRAYAKAIVREGDTVYTNVAIHVKGSAGSFTDIQNKPALTLSFGKYEEGQRFHGLRKIHLNNSVQDRSFTTENICGEMFRKAGVPAARATNARVWLNGRDLGFFVVMEGFTKDFLKRHFKDTRGNFYEGGFLKDIDNGVRKDSGEANDSDLKALTQAVYLPDGDKRWAALNKVLDMERFLSFMAMESLVWDWDGYMMNRNNYRFYHDPDSDKFVFIPHGMDQMFWDANGSVFQPNFGGVVARAVVETTEGQRLFRERVRRLYGEVYKLEALTNRFDQLAQRNRPAVAELGQDQLRDYDENITMVRQRIVERWHGIQLQFERETPTVKAIADGADAPVASATPVGPERWQPAAAGGAGTKTDQPTVGGKPTLRISAEQKSFASWRATVRLEAGRYRFEGLARASKVVSGPDPKGEGAGIRVSGASRQNGNKLVGDADWTKMRFDFEVTPVAGEVVLICELRADSGEAWFDTASLQLLRLK